MHPMVKICPTCGSRKIRLVRSDFPTSVRGRKVIIKDVERQECPVCGEVLFDRPAMKKLQAAWPNKHKKSA